MFKHTESELAFAARDGLPLNGILLSPEQQDSPGPLPAVVLVHGAGSNRLYLVPWGRELARRGFRALSIATRGSGWSWSHEGKQYGAGYERVSDAPLDIGGAIDALRRLGHTQFIVAGSSLGAVKTTYTQAWAPIEGVVGIVPWSGPRFTAEALALDGEGFASSMRTAQELVARGQPEATFEAVKPFARPFAASAFVDKYGPHGRYDWVANLWRVAVPKLVILGSADPSVLVGAARDEIQRWERLPPQCEFHIMPGWGHGFGAHVEDDAAVIAQLVADWWARVRPAS